MARKEDNLMPIAEVNSRRTREQHSADSRKAGIASGKARRRRKALNETLNDLLSMPIQDGKTKDLESIKSLASIKGKNITVQEALVLAQIQKALKGDAKAARLLFELLCDNASGTMEHDDGLLEALNGTAKEDWSNESESDIPI